MCALTREASVYLLPYVWPCDGCWALRNELDTDRPLPPRASGLDKTEEMTESNKKTCLPGHISEIGSRLWVCEILAYRLPAAARHLSKSPLASCSFCLTCHASPLLALRWPLCTLVQPPRELGCSEHSGFNGLSGHLAFAQVVLSGKCPLPFRLLTPTHSSELASQLPLWVAFPASRSRQPLGTCPCSPLHFSEHSQTL